MRIFYVMLLSLAFIGCGTDDPVQAANDAIDNVGNEIDNAGDEIDNAGDEIEDTQRLALASTLYTASCGRSNNGSSSCHNDEASDLSVPNKRNRTTTMIRGAIDANTGGMGFLSVLTDAQLIEIAYAISAI